ncbi:MAG: glycosyltransferase [Gammaproteobacteria bacterium]|nr:glycosyltransferase [Gammaproteobacteria bacterium]
MSSVRKQTYRNWELCIADDASASEETLRVLRKLDDERIKLVTLPENRNISGATNAAAELAGGRYLAFMDNDDVLSEDALAEVAAVIRDTGADFIYTDEDFIRTDGHLDNPHLKPDYNPDLLLSHNYITHLLVLEKDLFERAGRLRPEYDGAQDYDLVLRAVEQAKRIVHVPKPLYHWRMSETSTSVNPTIKAGGNENARKAVEDALRRRSIDGTVEEAGLPHYFRVRRRIAGAPRVDIIIPFRDKPELLDRCVASILERSTWSAFRILGVSNNSRESSTHDEMERLRALDDRVAFCELDCEFNFSRLVNHGVSRTDGNHVLLLNNDMEIISPDWIEALLEHSQRPDVAAVGGKLYYPNNTVQHAGIAIGLGGYAGHLHQRARASSPGYFNRLNVIQNISAVTGAMMMVERRKYMELGMFDEMDFGVAYNDVDFCLRAREQGYLNVFTPYAEAYHYESRSRGYEDTPEKQERFNRDKENLLRRHGPVIEKGDPYYNSNFDRSRDDFRLPSEPASVARG